MPPYDENYELRRQLDELQSQTVSCCSFAVTIDIFTAHITAQGSINLRYTWQKNPAHCTSASVNRQTTLL